MRNPCRLPTIHWNNLTMIKRILPWLGLIALSGATLFANPSASRPNIVWLSTEDISPHIGFMGDPHAITPHLDQLANEGVVFNRTYTTAGVCAPVRSAIITGMYQSTIGTQHMRSAAQLPDHVELFPAYLRRAGYYTTNNSKTDYQLPKKDPAIAAAWDDSSPDGHWRNRPAADQPFFAVFNFGGTHESGIEQDEKYREVTANLTPDQRQDPAALTTYPPYYPETPAARENWKRNYELITAMDAWRSTSLRPSCSRTTASTKTLSSFSGPTMASDCRARNVGSTNRAPTSRSPCACPRPIAHPIKSLPAPSIRN